MLKGISGDGGSVEVDAVDSGLASARGSACSKERRVVELLDTVARREVEGERVYGEGAAAVASAMAGEREGEELERRGGVWGVRESEGERSTSLAGRVEWRGGEQVRGTHAVLAVEHLPACLAGQVARWRGAGLGRQVGRCWATGKPFPIFFLFSVFINTSATLLN